MIISYVAVMSFLCCAQSEEMDEKVQRTEAEAIKKLLKAQVIQTGERSGQVIDAITGKPVVKAVVSFQWNLLIFGPMRSGESIASVYEVLTDENGKYYVTSQEIHKAEGIPAKLQPEEVRIYKSGYVGSFVHRHTIKGFLEYVPELNHRYLPINATIMLQPWKEEFSHAEHLAAFDYDEFGLHRPEKFIEASKDELKLAQQEKEAALEAIEYEKKLSIKFHKSKHQYYKKQLTQDEYLARLHEYLETNDPHTLSGVSLALHRLGDIQGIPAWIGFMRKNLYRTCFNHGIRLFGQVSVVELQCPVTIPQREVLVRKLERWWSRNQKIDFINYFGSMAVGSRNPKIRERAMKTLSDSSNSQATPYLIKCLENDPRYCRDIYPFFIKIGDRSVIPHIKKYLNHKNDYVKMATAAFLKEFGDDSGIGNLIRLLDSDTPGKRSEAARYLHRFGHDEFYGPHGEIKPDTVEKWKSWWNQQHSQGNK
ncbi:MAG: HEAT repeat domain-containing protein [Sedimentisphaerales bacterium]|nr:HEAT repeat domain-containing protein [Sedimentisphaerales bacterium]